MMKFPFLLVLCFLIVGAARADPVLCVPGTSPPNVIASNPDASWSEPPDMNGLIGSSEQILVYGLATEIANDFFDDTGGVSQVTWWSGLYNNYSCNDDVTTGFVLRFYDDAGCIPGTLLLEATPATTQGFVGCQSGIYPMFRNSALIYFSGYEDVRYWFGAVQLDHAFPPQSGRLASGGVIGCDSVFKSAYFSYPDWTPVIDVFGVAFDCSQEFQGGIPPPPDDPGACCLGDQGECEVMWYDDCQDQNGQYQGDGVPCDPNPCQATPAEHTTWSEIKGAYR